MRKLLRSMAKFRMMKNGTTKVNKRMSNGRWRRYIDAYPTNAITGKKMTSTFIGTKNGRQHHKKQRREDCAYIYC